MPNNPRQTIPDDDSLGTSLGDPLSGWGPLKGIEMWGDRRTADIENISIFGFRDCVAEARSALRSGALAASNGLDADA